TVDMVQDFDNALDTALSRIVFARQRGELFLEDPFNFAQYFRRGPVHGRYALGNVALDFVRQGAQDNRGLRRLKIGQDQGYCLRMLLLDKVQQVRRVSSADKVEGPHLKRAGQAIDDVNGLLASKRLLQELPCVVDSPGCNEVLSHHQLLELHEN